MLVQILLLKAKLLFQNYSLYFFYLKSHQFIPHFSSKSQSYQEGRITYFKKRQIVLLKFRVRRVISQVILKEGCLLVTGMVRGTTQQGTRTTISPIAPQRRKWAQEHSTLAKNRY